MNNEILNINKNINRNLGNRLLQPILIQWAKKKSTLYHGTCRACVEHFEFPW